MSEKVVFGRRDFLKLLGVGVAGATTGCAQPPDQLIPYLVPPKDVLPGIPYWYASTCTECAAGCGILVKTREGRAIKLEGNPEHPVNRGGLCARGHASLQGLYDADRVKAPMLKQGGAWKQITWDEALKTAGERIAAARQGGKGVALITAHHPGSLDRLAADWAKGAGATRLVYEPFSNQALREANRRTFGLDAIPTYDFEQAHAIVSFGADFLETWVSPMSQSRGFAAMRARTDSGYFAVVEPRLSLTGANADEWLAAVPGTEFAVALGMAHVILVEGLASGGAERGALVDAVASYGPDAVEQMTQVPAEALRTLARRFAAAKPSLAVAGGIAGQSEQSLSLLAAVNLLNYAAGNVGRTVRFDRTINEESVSPFSELQALATRMSGGGVDVLVVEGANPVYATPPWAGFPAAMDHVPFKVAIGGTMDETAERCDLVLPARHSLESLGDVHSARGVYSLTQPSMQPLPMFDARTAGDALIGLAQAGGFASGMPGTWTDYLKREWRALQGRLGRGGDFETFWTNALQKGGVWEDVSAQPVRWASTPAFVAPQLRGGGDFTLVVYPTGALHDGRGANKPWLQELPDPTTKAVWGSWAEIHPETAERLGIAQGQAVKVETEAGSVEVPAYLYSGIRKDTVAIPLGQGHTAYGRWAKGRGVNALVLLPEALDGASSAVAYLSAKAKVSPGTKAMDLVVTQREKNQHDRELAQIVPLAALLGGTAAAGAAHGATNGHGATKGHGAAAVDEHGHDPSVHADEPAAHGGHGGGHHEPHPSQTRPGRHTEPRVIPQGEKIPAHAMTAAEPFERVRGPRQKPITEGDYGKAKHRWAMAVDLNSCTGCSACVTACYAENNVPVVGPEMIKRGREMSWIRIERYEEWGEPGAKKDVRHLPMMCQQCGDAPCEIVCPVYATYHNPEGLNAQIYNRCVGTRYCSNNCPYKVRAFNWFDYTAPEKSTFAFPEPLNWQLNPDVTVRSKGVMEKCTFCVQRILESKGNARDEGRDLRDGEIQTACSQSCPSQAIVFGDLMDPESRVSRLSHGDRRYWVLNELNTKPGITYLKRIDRSEPA